MKTITTLFLTSLILVACAHKSDTAESTAEAKIKLEERWKGRLGSANKEEFVSEFGNPAWCKLSAGQEETCRFYKKIRTKWIGEAPDKKPIELFDEIVAEFGTDGTLRQFKANALR